LAPTAGRIVVLIARFFNCDRLDVGICPGVELVAIECNTLFSNADFSQVWPDGVLEFFSAHTEVCGSLHCSDEAGRRLYGLHCLCIGHRDSSPAIAGRLSDC